MKLEAVHEILVAGDSFDICEKKILRFFMRNLLVRYDTVRIVEEESINAVNPQFWDRVEKGMAANREVLKGLAEELTAEGYGSVADLMGMPQGYHCKTLHTAVHMLDGFLGIDTCFYSYEDDSHWVVSEATSRRIMASPEGFWLLKVAGESQVQDWEQSLRKAETGVYKE